MTRRTGIAITIGFALGALAALPAFVADWRDSSVGRVVLWPAYLTVRAFPPPCFDRGPGQPPFCEGTPVQLFAVLLGLILTFAFYFGLGVAVSWASLRPKGLHNEPAA